MTGTVKRLVKDRGFGFIRDERGVEYFFHRSAVQNGKGVNAYDDLHEGALVAFDEQDGGHKGPRAINISRY